MGDLGQELGPVGRFEAGLGRIGGAGRVLAKGPSERVEPGLPSALHVVVGLARWKPSELEAVGGPGAPWRGHLLRQQVADREMGRSDDDTHRHDAHRTVGRCTQPRHDANDGAARRAGEQDHGVAAPCPSSDGGPVHREPAAERVAAEHHENGAEVERANPIGAEEQHGHGRAPDERAGHRVGGLVDHGQPGEGHDVRGQHPEPDDRRDKRDGTTDDRPDGRLHHVATRHRTSLSARSLGNLRAVTAEA